MRKFTKEHNDIQWLFPTLEDSKEVSEGIFDECEEQAKYRAERAEIKDEDKDLAIDCYMKGCSDTLQRYSEMIFRQTITRIYENLFKVKKPTKADDEEAWHEYLRFNEVNMLLEDLASRRELSKTVEKWRQIVYDKITETDLDRKHFEDYIDSLNAKQEAESQNETK